MLYPSAYEKKEILKKEYYGDGIDGEFEGIQVRMPSEYDRVLTQLYGDYMQLPPEEKRVPSHVSMLNETEENGEH